MGKKPSKTEFRFTVTIRDAEKYAAVEKAAKKDSRTLTSWVNKVIDDRLANDASAAR